VQAEVENIPIRNCLRTNPLFAPVEGAYMETTTQLKSLMDYTLFHIGAYITLTTLLVALLGLEGFKQRATTMQPFLVATLLFFVAAGACGGIVASNIPYFKSFSELSSTKIGPFFAVRALPLVWWTSLEHIFFWGGVLSALTGVVYSVCIGRSKIRSAADTADRASQVGNACIEAAKRVPPEDQPNFIRIGSELLLLASKADKQATGS
jgi:hypothetical protein